MHMPFCCSNNRISAVGALSLGLQVNQTLRIPAVSASLMGKAPAQTCLCLSTQTLPPLHLLTPVAVGTWVPEPRWGRGPPGFLM